MVNCSIYMALGRIPPDSISNTAYENKITATPIIRTQLYDLVIVSYQISTLLHTLVFICSCGVKSYKKKKNQTQNRL